MSIFTTQEQKNYFFSRFRADLLRIIDDPKFKKNIGDLLRSVNPDKIKITDSGFKYTTREEIPRTISISITETAITYREEYINYENTGIYNISKKGRLYTKYTETHTEIKKNNFNGKKNKKYNKHRIDQKTEFNAFDEQGIQIWRLEETKQDTFYQQKKSNVQILTEPDHFENYHEKQYCFRAEDKIIKRVIKKYANPEEKLEIKNLDSYLIGKNNYPDNKNLPKGGDYIFFPEELFVGYKLGQNNIDELWAARGTQKIKNK